MKKFISQWFKKAFSAPSLSRFEPIKTTGIYLALVGLIFLILALSMGLLKCTQQLF